MPKARSAAEALAKQQQKWEKKKDKLEKKSESARATVRQSEKETKRMQKEAQYLDGKEDKVQKAINRQISRARWAIGVLLIVSYLVIVLYFMKAEESASEAPTSLLGSGTLTVALMVAFVALAFGTEGWKAKLMREAQQREAASLIKGTIEQKQAEKERDEQLKARRLQQAKEFKARMERRAKDEAAMMQKAMEIARGLRERRQAREAEERQAAAAAAAAAIAEDDTERDDHGWTARQRQLLRDAVAKYPETWSHSKKARWEVIASEVGGRDARGCEEAWARVEREKAAAAEAKAKNKDAKPDASKGARLEDDLDWMTGEGDWSASLDDGADDDDDDEDEDEDDERPRMAVEAEPEHKGTEIRLEGIKEMLACATVQVELLHLQLSCIGCRTAMRLFVSGADEDAADAKTWCEGCSGLVAVHLRPTLLHAANPRLCYVDCVRCTVTDVLPSVLMSVCESCGAENVHKQEFIRNRVNSGGCLKCHAKYAFGAEAIRIEQVTPCDQGHSGGSGGSRSRGAEDDAMDEIAEELRYLRKKAKSDPRQQMIQLGKPLPQLGACAHFKKSYKWYRFACCGRAFPCPECHVESGCPAAPLGAHATRMICGKCSMEQSYAPARPCEKCSFIMMARGSSHWDGGGGTRSLAAMSTKDAKKFKGGVRQVRCVRGVLLEARSL